jgi:predicted O-methyltransferase YrrM
MNKYLDPKKYWNKVNYLWNKIHYEIPYDIEKAKIVEKLKFDARGFNFDNAKEKLDKVLNELNKPAFASQKGMGSVHWVLFCAISQVANVKKILEIGTFDGETTLLLSKIFPDSDIKTIDLPEADPIFSKSYRRDNDKYRKEFKTKQSKNLSDKKIEYIAKNSFFIPAVVNQKFDLVWIDGGHLYPEVAWDICNSYHLCNPGGWLMCDDVMSDKYPYKDDDVSTESYQVLEYIKERTGEEITYFLKRDSPQWSANPQKRKYVAAMRRSEET